MNRAWHNFKYWSVENIKTCRAFFWARCHHGLFSDIVDCPFPDKKLIKILFWLAVFLLFGFLVMSGTCTQKKCQNNCNGRELSAISAGEVSMSGLNGKRVVNSPQRKLISKNRRQEVERVNESEIVPNRHVIISIFGREIEEKVEK